MKLSKEQKASLAAKLDSPWGSVELICDGQRVTLQVRPWSQLTYRVMTYVNGWFKGEWMSGREAHPEQKFLRKTERPLHSPAERAKAVKALGKRYVAKSSFLNATIVLYRNDWTSGKAAIAHLCRVCDSVEIVDPAPAIAQEGAPA